MPIGILLVNEQYEIEWSNPYMQGVLKKETLVGEGIVDISDDIYVLMKTEEKMKQQLHYMIVNIECTIKEKSDYCISSI